MWWIIIAAVLSIALVVTSVWGAVLVPLLLPRARAYAPTVAEVADTYCLDPYLVLAVAGAESGFDPQAVSSAGAVGLMQLMPDTARWICAREGWAYQPNRLTDPSYSIALGCYYLAYLSAKFDGTWVLAAYNAGEGVVREWMRAGRGVEDIPYAETRAYVAKVTKLAKAYRARRICG